MSDSTSLVRHPVPPPRPEGAEGWAQADLAAIVTRDAMIGVVPVTLGREAA